MSSFLNRMQASVKRTLQFVGGATMLYYFGSNAYELYRSRLPDRMVLCLSLNGPLVEKLPDGDLRLFVRGPQAHALVVRDVVDTIHAASKDPRVRGIVCRIGPLFSGRASHIAEIRQAILDFNASDRPAPASVLARQHTAAHVSAAVDASIVGASTSGSSSNMGDGSAAAIAVDVGEAQTTESIQRLAVAGSDLAEKMSRVTFMQAYHRDRRFSICSVDTFGELMGGLLPYYLASAFQQVHVMPEGFVSLADLRAEQPFLRQMLGKLGVSFKVVRREKYKTASNSLICDAYTEEDREQIGKVISDLRAEIVRDIAAARPAVDPASLDRLLRAGAPLTAAQAIKEGLVDGFMYADQIVAEACRMVSHERPDLQAIQPPSPSPASSSQLPLPTSPTQSSQPTLQQQVAQQQQLPQQQQFNSAKAKAAREVLVPFTQYSLILQNKRFKDARITLRAAPYVALINMDGIITRESAIEVCDNLERALWDEKAKAVVLRVNSPGGSAVASASILHMVRSLKESNKPVVVSMGPVAASGGYYVAAQASRIVAHPTTVTGSIGVIITYPNVQELLRKAGVNVDVVELGDNNSGGGSGGNRARNNNTEDSSSSTNSNSNSNSRNGSGPQPALGSLSSMARPLTPEEEAILERDATAVYTTFMRKVADGRELTMSAVQQIAQGRVWSGRDALRVGLVDELGTLDSAFAAAKRLAGLEAVDAAVQLREIKDPGTPLQQLLQSLTRMKPAPRRDDPRYYWTHAGRGSVSSGGSSSGSGLVVAAAAAAAASAILSAAEGDNASSAGAATATAAAAAVAVQSAAPGQASLLAGTLQLLQQPGAVQMFDDRVLTTP
eukprot:m.142317 g.142317  ORF g.142317 m.142317 type:complete len:841 (-) comp16708_c0_seq12:2467-4989(-)